MRALVLVGVIAVLVSPETRAAPAAYHKLGVYSLGQYEATGYYLNGNYHYDVWKGYVEPDHTWQDPYDDFWAAMTSCSNPECAHALSRRFKDAEVVHANIVGNNDFVLDNWNDFDLVFFYGHNNFIVPPHPHYEFTYHLYDHGNNHWNQYTAPDEGAMGWGQQTPYDYHYYHVTDAATHPGAVIYSRNAFTSLLIGYSDFKKNQWVTYRDVWWQPDKYYYSSGLGANVLKWLFLHGCQALIVANENGSQYDDRGLQAFIPAWGTIHMVLGHYRSFSLYDLPDLMPFANSLKSGMPVKQAYFALDATTHNSSVISGENESSRTCSWVYYNGGWHWVCYINQSATVMESDKWTAPKPDVPPTWYYVKWIQQL